MDFFLRILGPLRLVNSNKTSPRMTQVTMRDKKLLLALELCY
jgi:hypothetical protein